MRYIFAYIFAFTTSLMFSLGQNINPSVGGITLAPLLTSGKSVDGDVHFYKNWSAGSVQINVGSAPVLLSNMMYDIAEDKVLAKTDEGIFAFPKGSLLGFSLKILDEKNNRIKTYQFVSGLEGIASFDVGSFFLLNYGSDKIKLLTKVSSSLQKKAGSSYGSKTEDYEYVREERLFIYKDGKGVEIKKNKKSILAALGGDTKDLENFIRVNKLNLKKEDEITALLKYFETKI